MMHRVLLMGRPVTNMSTGFLLFNPIWHLFCSTVNVRCVWLT
jgi:hypothetical protein